MTPFQERLYQFIESYINKHEDSPSFTVMVQAMGIRITSKSLITQSLRVLQQERKVRLVKSGRRLLITLVKNELSLLGKISAGGPIEACNNPEPVNWAGLLKDTPGFALKVEGDSMVEANILDKDIIFCKQVSFAKEGDIVVALIDNTNATLKRISFIDKPLITLLPANKAYKPQIYKTHQVQIQGVYVGILHHG